MIGEKFFKNIAGLTINNSKLKKISQNDLKEFPKLKEIFIISNEVENLDSNLFEFNKSLKLVWIEGNKIKKIGAEIFDELHELIFINIREIQSCIGMKKIVEDKFDRNKVEISESKIEKFIEKVVKKKC